EEPRLDRRGPPPSLWREGEPRGLGVELAVGADLQPPPGGGAAGRGGGPVRAGGGRAAPVRGAGGVGGVERPDQPLGDAGARQNGERGVRGDDLEPVAVLEPAEGSGEPAAAGGERRQLEDRLALRRVVAVGEVDGSGPEVADRRRQARVL